MNKKDLRSIEEALKKTPNNIALRLTYALKLFKLKDFDTSEKNYKAVLKLDPNNTKAKQGLVELYFVKENYSAVIIIAEELVKVNSASEKMMELYAKALLRQNNLSEAQTIYDRLIHNNPFYFDEELDSVLEDQDEYLNDEEFGEDDDFEGDGFEDFFDNPFFSDENHLYLPESDIDFTKIIGLDYIKKLVSYKSMLLDSEAPALKVNKFGLLLFGPPGCGKTYFVKSMPKELDVKVLPVGIDRLHDIYSYNLDGLLHYYFGKMRVYGPSALFIDELERFGQTRTPDAGQETRQVTSKLLEELEGIRFQDQPQFVIGATNVPWEIDPVFFSAGKFDYVQFVGPPSAEDRLTYIKKSYKLYNLTDAELDEVVVKTSFFSYAELNHLMDVAYVDNLILNKRKGKLVFVNFQKAISNIYPFAKYWHAMFLDKWPKQLESHPMSIQVREAFSGY